MPIERAMGVNIAEQEVGGGFSGPGRGRLFFFETALRGPDLKENISLDEFSRYFDSSGRAYQLLQLYFATRWNNQSPPAITFARVTSSTSVRATLTLNDRQGSPAPTLRVDARGSGTASNGAAGGLSVQVVDGRATGTFDLVVRWNAVAVQTHSALNMNPASDRYAPTIINRDSFYLTATDLSPNNVYAITDNPAVLAATGLAGGSNGGALTDADYLAALTRLTNVRGSGFLYTPYPSAAVAAALLQAGSYKYALVDIASGSNFAAARTQRANYTSSFGEAVQGEGFTFANPNALLPLAISRIGLQLVLDQQSGPHYPASNYNILQGIEFSDAYLSDARVNAQNYELEGITHFRPLPSGGIGPVGIQTCSSSRYFSFTGVRRTFWYVEEQLERIIAPFLHKALLTPGTMRDIDTSVGAFFTGLVEARNMVVGPAGSPGVRGQGWEWRADGTSTPQSRLDAGGLTALLGMRVAQVINDVQINATPDMTFAQLAVSQTGTTETEA